MLDAADEQARIRIPGHNRGLAAVAAFFPAGFRIQQQVAFELLGTGAMTGIAMFYQYRTDFLFKESRPIDICRGGRRGGKQKDRKVFHGVLETE